MNTEILFHSKHLREKVRSNEIFLMEIIVMEDHTAFKFAVSK